MAATKKALAVQEAKRALRAEYQAVVESVIQACKTVPQSVVSGSAQLAVAWRDAAEEAIKMVGLLPKRASIEDMQKRIADARAEEAWLRNPAVVARTGERA